MRDGEKYIEKRLVEEISKRGGLCVKLTSSIGLPDRMCLLPEGAVIFIEVKSKGQKPRKNQLIIHNRLRLLKFRVLVIDSYDKLCDFLTTL